MKAKRDGLIIGLVTGVVAGTLSYLTLSHSDKNLLLKESEEKRDDINKLIKELNHHFLESANAKIDYSKKNLDGFKQLATEKAEELFDKAKSTVDVYSKQVEEYLKDLKNHKEDSF